MAPWWSVHFRQTVLMPFHYRIPPQAFIGTRRIKPSVITYRSAPARLALRGTNLAENADCIEAVVRAWQQAPVG
jgi:hypothetical protein